MSWGDEPEPAQLQPMNLGDVLDGMFRILRGHWRTLTLALGMLIVPITLVVSVITFQAVGTSPGFLDMVNDPDAASEFLLAEPEVNFGALGVAGLIGLLSGVFLTPLINGTASVIAARAYQGGAPQIGESLRAALARYWSLVGAMILTGLAVVGVILAPVVLMIAGARVQSGGLVAIGALSMLVTIVMAVIVGIRLVLAVPVIVVEHVGAVEALRRSWRLVKGRTGIVFGTVLLVYLIAAIVGMIIATPFGAAGAAVGNTPGLVGQTVGDIVTTLLTTALTSTAIVLVYFDRRIRKEGLDLERLAEELEQNTGDAAG